ncbi:MAG: BLUF domain-containing protein [Burkholderiaceae bacterium]
MLVRLLYVSRSQSASADDTDAIVAASRRNNPAVGITGILCYSGGIYLQAIEGGRDAVNRLFLRISQDCRHKEVVLLHYEEITERRFGGWTMGQVNLSKINASIVLKYSPLPELDPYTVSGQVSLALLEELMASACIMGRA